MTGYTFIRSDGAEIEIEAPSLADAETLAEDQVGEWQWTSVVKWYTEDAQFEPKATTERGA